jgi:ribosomal protein S18 acetylase RimI-like enzyme
MSTMSATVSLVRESERERVVDILVAAFENDPVERWMYPEPERYFAHFPVFLAAFGGKAFETRTAWRLGDFSAVALWLSPGAEPDDDAIVKVLSETVSPVLHGDLFAVLDQMTAAHPEFPHWYLPWLAVDPGLQGKGLGGALLEHGLRIVDASHLPVYLETPNPRTVAFYARHGFRVVGEAQAGTCPPLALLLRAGR